MNPGRNDPCPCASGKKYKHCCGQVTGVVAARETLNLHEIGPLVAMVEQGRLREAERKARALLVVHPNAAMLWKILSVALVRQGKDGLQALQRTAELMPHDGEAHSNLGAALHDRRRWGEALVSLRRALEIRPSDVQTLIDAANVLRALGQARESVTLYQRALQLNPREREAQNNLGNAFLELEQCADAAACYRLALEMKPNDAQIYCNLGNALRQLGQVQEAMACSQRAIALEPGLSMAHNNLALLLAASGRRQEAVASYRRAVMLNPAYVEAHVNLGNVLRDLGERREALSHYARAVELDPKRADSQCDLGNVLFELRRLDEAAGSFHRALALQPEHTAARLGLAAVLRLQGRASEAETLAREVLTHDPNSADALALLGELYADRGQFGEAHELFQRVIAIDPLAASAYPSIAAHRRMSRADGEWLRGAQALLERQLPLAHEINLRYALGKYFDDIEEYDSAFGHYRQANELSKRHAASYERVKLSQRIDRAIAGVDAAFMRQVHERASASEVPVFIIGMPRSGTSLTEQILASHPSVFGAGEVRFWDAAFAALESAGLRSEAAVGLLPGMIGDYLERVTRASGAALRVVDKMPANFLYTGLIHAAFPQARIIHMQRHPVDTCLSIYFQNFFNTVAYAHDLEHLAHYYGEYLRITDHWRAVLPATSLLEIPYEALIQDQEGSTRRMLDFIGLPWDAACLDFHETDRVVLTASKWQVRQRIHGASAGRWRNYEKYVAPLLHLTALAPQRQRTAQLPRKGCET